MAMCCYVNVAVFLLGLDGSNCDPQKTGKKKKKKKEKRTPPIVRTVPSAHTAHKTFAIIPSTSPLITCT
jgi:hypothetical protein